MSGVAMCSIFILKFKLLSWAIYVSLHQEWCEIILYLLLFQLFAREMNESEWNKGVLRLHMDDSVTVLTVEKS
jgi:hypothetical protein